MFSHPEDRPDPAEQPIRARVPDHVAGGCFSTGVIVMTAQTEFILDFVQNLGRPHQIVARVVMPHGVLPQLVDALGRNIQLYRGRWGELPNPLGTHQSLVQAPLPNNQNTPTSQSIPATQSPSTFPVATDQGQLNTGSPSHTPGAQIPNAPGVAGQSAPGTNPSMQPPQAASNPPASEPPVRQANAQEIYDDLKIRDELLSGSYANAVMIGHGPHEFSFDFITNFYPHSAVSTRVFLAAGQVPRLYDSLKGTWDQLRLRMQPPPPTNM